VKRLAALCVLLALGCRRAPPPPPTAVGEPIPFQPHDGPIRNPLNLYDVMIDGSPDFETAGTLFDQKVTMRDLDAQCGGAFSRIGDRIYSARETGWQWLVEHTALERNARAAGLELLPYLRRELAALVPPAGLSGDALSEWRLKAWEWKRSLLVQDGLKGVPYERIRFLINLGKWGRPDTVEAKLDGREITRAEMRQLAGWKEELARSEYFQIAQLQFDQFVERHVLEAEAKRRHTEPEAMLDAIAHQRPITDKEVRDFIAGNPAYGSDPDGFERAKDNVRRLRVINARKQLVDQARASGAKFLLRAPTAPPTTVELPAPRRLGDPKSPNLMVAFHALGCPECSMGTQLLEQIVSEHEGRLQLAAGDYFRPVTTRSYRLALALRCADEQGRWWPLMGELEKRGSETAPEPLRAAATAAKLDGGRFDACLAADRYLPDVMESLRLAERVGLEYSVPGFFVNGTRLSELGHPEKVRAQVDSLLR
jgi:protein-disulfide isomerase